MRSFLVRKINNFTKTLFLRAKLPNTYGARLYILYANPKTDIKTYCLMLFYHPHLTTSYAPSSEL